MRAIIHEIVKESKQGKPDTYPSDDLLAVEDAQPLIEKLFNLFEKSTGDRKYVNFLTEEQLDYSIVNQFPVALRDYLNDKQFVSFTIKALVSLTELIGKIPGARGGYYIFCEYEERLGIFLVRDSRGNVFTRETNKSKRGFKVNKLTYTNLDKLALSCVLNLNWLNPHSNQLWNAPRECLSLIFSQDESNYFYDWLCLEKDTLKSSISFTKELVAGLNIISNSANVPINPKTNQRYSPEEFREEAKNFITTSGDRKVHLRKLSEHFYGDPGQLPKLLTAQECVLDDVFDYDKSKLEKLSQVTLIAGKIRLKIPQSYFENETIRVVEEKGKTLVIIESDELASRIRSFNDNGKAD